MGRSGRDVRLHCWRHDDCGHGDVGTRGQRGDWDAKPTSKVVCAHTCVYKCVHMHESVVYGVLGKRVER